MTKRKKRRPVGETIGGIIVGFDQQIFRTLPPAHELILKGQPVRGLSGQDGSELRVIFPDDYGPRSFRPCSATCPRRQWRGCHVVCRQP